MFDTIIKGGEVIDGTGGPAYTADVAVKNGVIAAVGLFDGVECAETVDAAGLAAAPGFIDMHTHSDFTLLADGRAQSQVHQGVTTEVVGQCGISCAPVCGDDVIPLVSPWYEPACAHKKWRSFGDYLDALDETDLGVNVMAFVGHGTVHRAVVGEELRAGEPDEVDEMARIVEQAIDEGAAGFSTGLEYWPGIMAAPDHLIPLCGAAAKRGRLYATHVRNRDTHYDLGFHEAIAAARESGVRLQISHIQPKFGAPGHAMEHTLEMIDLAQKRGADIAFDVIPHDWSHTIMAAILPKWAQAGGVDEILKRLSDPETREKIKANPRPMWLLVKSRQWSDVVLLNAAVNHDLTGLDFEEIGKMRGVDPYDAVLDILLEEGENLMGVIWSSRSFRGDDIEMCLGRSECAVISDTVAVAPDGVLKDHIGSLTGYGWAARFLQHYVRDREILPLPEAVAKITSVPAGRLGLKDRGVLRPGMKADICVFDPAKIAVNCTAKHPRRYASGIAHVMVNGEFSMRGGERTDSNPGEVLRNLNG